jgi:hypothetical protein
MAKKRELQTSKLLVRGEIILWYDPDPDPGSLSISGAGSV